MVNGLKVYYLPIQIFYNQCVLPTMVSNIPLIRYILIRERIEIIHGHSAFSALAHEALLIGNLMGMKVKIDQNVTITITFEFSRQFLLIIACLALQMQVL